MPQISAIGKYLDQPLLTAKINHYIPPVLAAGSAGITINNIVEAPQGEKKKAGIKTAIITAATSIMAISAPKIASMATGRAASKTLSEIKKANSVIVEDFLKNNKVSSNIENILTKAKTKVLSLKEVAQLRGDKTVNGVFDKLIPPPDNISSKDIFKEIGWLSIYGAVPVAGGIAGGVAADRITEKNWKKRVANKVKEGTYQYLANIFLCNIGAGAALGVLEKLNIKSKAARCVGMLSGILLTGVIGGSVIANYIGNKFINPLLSHGDKKKDIRTPELLDLSLHTDDIATISLLSGLKWIEPSLPILYSISGYRAGIGYRNDPKHKHKD